MPSSAWPGDAGTPAAGALPAREGTALCQGIIICGGCGAPMAANYHGDDRASYECHSHRDGKKTPGCRGIAAHAVDAAVAAVLLQALTPEQVTLALAAADEVAGRHQRASRAAGLAVERARYEADRAERAFSAVEPENRLVARALEARWEARLTALADAEQALAAAQDALPPLPDRASLAKLTADLPALWHAPTTTARDRKRLLRTLIADITLLPRSRPRQGQDRDPRASGSASTGTRRRSIWSSSGRGWTSSSSTARVIRRPTLPVTMSP